MRKSRPKNKVVQVMPFFDMQIREIMTHEIVTISPAASAADAARLMREADVGILPVVDGDKVAGVVTDRDLVVRVMAAGLDKTCTPVRDVMTAEVVYCFEDEDVQAAVYSIEARQVRRVLVLDRKQKLVGVLSLGDIAVDTGNKFVAGDALKKVSEPTHN